MAISEERCLLDYGTRTSKLAFAKQPNLHPLEVSKWSFPGSIILNLLVKTSIY